MYGWADQSIAVSGRTSTLVEDPDSSADNRVSRLQELWDARNGKAARNFGHNANSISAQYAVWYFPGVNSFLIARLTCLRPIKERFL